MYTIIFVVGKKKFNIKILDPTIKYPKTKLRLLYWLTKELKKKIRTNFTYLKNRKIKN